MTETPIIKIGTDEVRPLIFTPENLQTFWHKARQFPTVYGHEIVDSWEKFMDLLFINEPTGLVPKGLFWVYKDGDKDFTGVFYINNMLMSEETPCDASVHYTFFDRKHHGRTELVKEMLKFVFLKYGFERLSVEIPNYATSQARHFAQALGFAYEGKRRNSARYKGEWFSTNLYGILRNEVLKEREETK